MNTTCYAYVGAHTEEGPFKMEGSRSPIYIINSEQTEWVSLNFNKWFHNVPFEDTFKKKNMFPNGNVIIKDNEHNIVFMN